MPQSQPSDSSATQITQYDLFCSNTTKLDEYALRPAAPKPLFVRTMEYLGKLQIDTRKIECLPQYIRSPDLQTNIDHNRFDYKLCVIRRGASNDRFQADTFRILNEKYEHSNITAKYTQTDPKKTKRSDTQ
jgi:hypothetical protein